jgi:hypothetical protein
MKIVESSDPYKMMSGMLFYDVLIFACQSMWYIKDWIINDPRFGAADMAALSREIHSTRCLLVSCDDPADEFHGMEIRTLLRRCRDSWDDIINRHYLSQIDTGLAQ